MGCCQHFDYFTSRDDGAQAFTVQMPRTTFGHGSLRELGPRLAAQGFETVAIVTDAWLREGEQLALARRSLAGAGLRFEEFSEVRIEPTDRSVMEATAFLKTADFDAVVSIGGGPVIDTAKAALVYAAYPAPFTTYFAPPVGDGQAVPGPVSYHLACPTTGGTGSEATAVSVIRITDLDTKFVLQSPHLFPDEAIIDPDFARTLPANVVASSGFDQLCHALECYTARAYTDWDHVEDPGRRPTTQGANPWSDMHAREALGLVGRYLARGVQDATDEEARGRLMWAAYLAGMAFGNSGTHLPHALSYGITHLARDYRAADYPTAFGPFVPHGISVIVNAPSVFRFVAGAAPERHLEAARHLGAATADAGPADAGEVVAGRLVELMQEVGIPNGIGAVGFGAADAAALADSAFRQRRAVANSPRSVTRNDLVEIFQGAVSYW